MSSVEGGLPSEYCVEKLEWCRYSMMKKMWDTFIRFDRIIMNVTDRQTDNGHLATTLDTLMHSIMRQKWAAFHCSLARGFPSYSFSFDRRTDEVQCFLYRWRPNDKFLKPEIIDSFTGFLQNGNPTAQIVYLELKDAYVFKALLVLKFAFMQRHCNNLYFLVDKRQFVVATYKLRSD